MHLAASHGGGVMIAAKHVRAAFSVHSRADIASLPDLTAEERRMAIEGCLDGWMGERVRLAASRESAISEIRYANHLSSSSGHGGGRSGSPDGVLVWIEEWEPDAPDDRGHARIRFVRGLRSGFISWGEIVDHARLGTTVAAQLPLLTGDGI